MFVRLLFALILTLGFSAKSWACSCAPWSGHVSEFTENYLSVWAVPVEAKIDSGKSRWDVTYKLDILEGYNRVSQTNITVNSSVADGGTCGINLKLGLPQFINVSKKSGAGSYRASSCTPKLPYGAIKLYLETGEDNFIPEWSTCHSWPPGGGHPSLPILNEALEDCDVWKGADHTSGFMGVKDRRQFSEMWRNRVVPTEPEKKPKKAQSWWPF